MKRRVICIWLPHLAAERALKNAPDRDRPLGIVSEVSGGLKLCSLNTAAREAGLICGMALADARAILPRLATVPQDAERDSAFLRAFGRWLQRFSPSVAPERMTGSDGTLLLDAGGCAHLFGGEAGMIAEIADGLARFGLTTLQGLADTRGGAWALARFGGENWIAPAGETRRVIEPLPVAALGIDAQICADLIRIGLKTVGDMAALPRASVAKRFGVETVKRLDRALGVEADPLAPMAQSAPHAVRMSLPEPVATTDAVVGALDRLLERLCARLEREGLGARRLELTVRRADGGSDSTGIGLMRPGRDAGMIARLFERGVADLDAGFGIDVIRLEATGVEPLVAAQVVSGETTQGEALDDVLSRIVNRIGFEAVIRVAPATSHIPERSWIRHSAAHSNPATGWPRPPAPRPITMLGPDPLTVEVTQTRTPPVRFVWQGHCYEVVRTFGPERITPEWWLDDPAWRTGLRDYWRIETTCAQRLWVFHTPEVPPESTALSRWYIHGIFA